MRAAGPLPADDAQMPASSREQSDRSQHTKPRSVGRLIGEISRGFCRATALLMCRFLSLVFGVPAFTIMGRVSNPKPHDSKADLIHFTLRPPLYELSPLVITFVEQVLQQQSESASDPMAERNQPAGASGHAKEVQSEKTEAMSPDDDREASTRLATLRELNFCARLEPFKVMLNGGTECRAVLEFEIGKADLFLSRDAEVRLTLLTVITPSVEVV